MQPKSIN